MTEKQNMVVEEINVLVVGNNPTELGHLDDDLKNIPDKKIVTAIAFDIRSIFERLANFRPTYILIDDNIGAPEVNNAVKALHRSRKTREIPITILKTSNYSAGVTTGVMNYVMKHNLTGISLYNELRNSLKLKATQQFLYTAWKKRKRQMLRLLR